MLAAAIAMGVPWLYSVLGIAGVVPQPALSVVPPSAVIPLEEEIDDPVAPLEEPPLPLEDALLLVEDPALPVDDPPVVLEEPGAPPDGAPVDEPPLLLDEPRPEDALAAGGPPVTMDDSLPHPTRSALVSAVTPRFRSTRTLVMGPPPRAHRTCANRAVRPHLHGRESSTR
jgi:hypothetical protein